MRTLIQLIPGAPPLVNGVGDYALTVARSLREDWDIHSTFLVCNPAWDGPDMFDGFRLIPLRSRRSTDLCSALEAMSVEGRHPLAVLLQLSPYGFDTNGSPFWLLGGLRRWRAGNPRARRLLIYFHELYATSAPWKRAFWVSPLQRMCARGMVRLSNAALTNREQYAERLLRWDPAKRGVIDTLAVVSNIGEPGSLRPLRERRCRLVVWGSAVSRSEVYGRHRQFLEEAVRAVDIEEIVSVGPGSTGGPKSLGGVPVLTLGVLPAAALSDLLSDSVLAALSYNPYYLAKSGIFAAYCAHGLPSILVPTHPIGGTDAGDGVRLDLDCMMAVPRAAVRGITMTMLESIARNAHEWYVGHDARRHARWVARMIEQIGTLE